jgi:hypothetical protein
MAVNVSRAQIDVISLGCELLTITRGNSKFPKLCICATLLFLRILSQTPFGQSRGSRRIVLADRPLLQRSGRRVSCVQVGANLDLLRTSSSISGAKTKNLTLRHPMNSSHVADPSQAFYAIPTQTP